MTSFPTRVLPVKKMWLNGSSSRAVATLDFAFEQAQLLVRRRTPLDDLVRRRCAVAGHRSVSLTMQQLPAAMAAASGPMTRPSGKFQGPRIRQTPRASWTILAVSFLFRDGDHLDRLHPLVEVGDVPLDVADDVQEFGDPDFAFRLAGVLLHRGHDLVAVSLHGRLQLAQPFLALLRGGGLHLPLMSPLQGEDPFDLRGCASSSLDSSTCHGLSSTQRAPIHPA